MFTNAKRIEEKTGRFGRGRFEYLQALVTEFQDTHKDESREQILANLANFAYDPINYDYLRQLNVTDLFIDMLTESNDKLIQFGIGGLCNLCLDKENRDIIIANDGLSLITNCLSSENEETVINAISTLYYLVCPETKSKIVIESIIGYMEGYASSSNPRIANLAQIFLQDHCNKISSR
ncbi:Armadillo repeat-containing protein 7 [Trichoplax sp. H2]|nr:Armadillo repeat-containing protein 7 [Trichoplax sp. H2]|eukprot:RDD42056.1 Armadillo repeat-containing protein 7 [Trichoplax sp. H2]